MPLSHLTSSDDELLADIANDLGGSVSHLTHSRAQILEVIADESGGSVSSLTSSPEQMLAAAVVASGGSASALTSSPTQLLAAFHNALSDEADVSVLTSSPSLILELTAEAAEQGGGGEVPEGFEAVTVDGVTVTLDGEPVYVEET